METKNHRFFKKPLARAVRNSLKTVLLAAVLFCPLGVLESWAQGLIKVQFPYSPINASSLSWMIAKDARIFEKYGLDVDLIYFGASSLILQSMLSGATNLAGFAGPAIVSNVIKGGDVISVAGVMPMTIPLITKSNIEKGEELKGKKIGVSRLGAVPHLLIQIILQHYGVKDATILQMGGQPEAAAALRSGVIDGAMVSAPLSTSLAKAGFRELVGVADYNKLGIKFIAQGIAARRVFATKNREIVIRMIKATEEAIRMMSSQENLAKKILAKYTHSDPELLDTVLKLTVETVLRDPTIPRESMASMARLMGELGLVDRATVNSTPAEAYYDNSYVDDVKQSGFLRDLWK